MTYEISCRLPQGADTEVHEKYIVAIGNKIYHCLLAVRRPAYGLLPLCDKAPLACMLDCDTLRPWLASAGARLLV